MAVIFLLLGLAQASLPAWGAAEPIALKEPVFRPRPAVPAPAEPGPKPAFKDSHFPVSDAENHREILALTGPLSPAETEFLEKNRFLLKPRPPFRPPSALVNDVMLAGFDSLGGPLAEHLRGPAHARHIGPDVFIQALNRYLAVRQAAVETGLMRELLHQVTAGLYHNAAVLRAGRSGLSAANWERLMAQLLVPLAILEQTRDDPAGDEGDLSAALARLGERRPDLPPGLISRVQTELRRVCLAQGKASGLLGLTPADSSPELDYAIFRPRGHYAADPAARAYFRAASWFQRMGWDTGSEAGLADALNFALALSYEPTEAPDPRAALARLMELSDFFYGPALAPGWAEWAPFLMKEAEVPEFTADTAAEPEVIKRLLAAAGSNLWPRGAIQLLTPRRSRPSLLAGELVSLWPDQAPPVFSALWLPTLWRHSLAEETIGRQLALAAPDSPENRLSARLPAPAGFLEKAGLKDRPEDYWFSSLGASWWPVWTTLTGRYGPGYPLYMRGRAFAAKELETIFGGLANLPAPLAATAAPGRPGPAPTRAETGADQPSAPLVKGFVEPNPDFWRQMTRLVRFLMASFQYLEIFPEDLEEGGALRRFLRRLDRAADISEKELTGQILTEDDYEFIRLFTLDWMAAPFGPPGTLPADRPETGAVSEIWSTPGAHVYEATADPWLMLVLVGNENSPRLTVGMAYNHYEFVSPLPRTRAEELWKRSLEAPDREHQLPPKNFWYEPLWPAR
ncbi:MAG: DUF3160 domain-containing protein [Candidatus Adiutrix sp.]|jgi:hypothetical protein|nr:DUF3160 domain-containing protein [Candidatus Adiutrix sp.]